MINAGSVVAFMELDTSKFSSGLKLAGSQLKNAAKDFKSAFDMGSGADLSTRFDKMGSSMRNLGGSLTSTGKSITQNISMPIAAAGLACTKLASDFATGMAKIKTIADTSKIPLNQLGDDIKKISMETGEDFKTLQEGMYEALSSGVKTEDATEFTETMSKAAVGGFTDTGTAVKGVTDILNAYGTVADKANTTKLVNQMMVAQNLGKTTFGEMAGYMGNVAATSAAAGVKTNELFSSMAVLTSNGIKTSEAVTGLKAALSNIINPSEKASKAADALGFKFNVAEMKTKGWMPFLDEVRAKLENAAPAYTAAADKVSELEAKIKSAQEGKTVNAEKYKAEIEAENKTIDELEKRKKTASNSVEKKRIEEEIAVHKEKIKTLKAEAEQAKKSYSAEQVAEWKKELKAAKDEQKNLEGASQDQLMGFATMFGSVEALNSVLALTSKSGKNLYSDSMEQMNSGKDYMQESYDIMMDTPEMKMKKAVASLKIAGIELGAAFLPYVSKIADGIVVIAKAFEALPSPIKNVIGTSLAFIAVLGPALMIGGKFISMTSMLFTALSKLSKSPTTIISAFSKIPGAFTKVISAFSKLKNVGNIFTLLSSLISGKVLLILGSVGLLAFAVYEVYKHWDTIGPYFSKTWTKLKSIFTDGDSFIGKIFLGWGAWIDKLLEKGKKFVIGWQYLLSKIGLAKPPSGEEAGKNISDGLASGINKNSEKATQATEGMGESLMDKFKKRLGIHSPSTVFRDYGLFIGQGLLGGMSSMEKSLIQQGMKYSQIIQPKISPVDIPKITLGNNLGNPGVFSKLKDTILHFNPTIHLYVTVADTGNKGTKKLTDEIKGMSQTALKDGLIDMFMEDAVRD